MSLKGNYFTSNLACQNLCDCSLCEIPIITDLNRENIKKENNEVKKNPKSRNILKKVSAVFIASVLFSLIYTGL